VSIDIELERASSLIENAEGLFLQFPTGSIERVAWENLKAHVNAWRAQQWIPDPERRMVRIHELRKQLDDVKALLCEAGLLGS
jgi:hypothetical protein